MFWSSRTPRVPTDVVYPIHSWDQSWGTRRFGIVLCLQFDAVLDAAILRDSLEELLSSHYEWRKLSGRLRQNSSNKLELHAPAAFTAKRPAFRFSFEDYGIPMATQVLAANLPRASPAIQVTADDHSCLPLFRSGRLISKLEDYLVSDLPVLGLHISRFSDATLIGLSFPHVVFDAGGLYYFLKSWTSLMRGQDIAPPASTKEDRLVALSGSADGESSILSIYLLSGWTFFVYIFWMVLDLARNPTVTTHSIYVPGSYIAKLRSEALSELPEGSWVSEGDVIYSWWLKLRFPNLTTGISAFLLADLRKRHECIPEDYVGNATTMLMVPLLDRETLGIGQSSIKIRTAIQEQTKPAEIARMANFMEAQRVKTGVEAICAAPGTMQTVISNWTRMNMLELDFSGAISEEMKGRQEGKGASPCYISTHWRANSIPMRNQLYVLGRDKTGGYWLHGWVPNREFEQFKNRIESSA